jgi:hypothetical protein
VACQLDPAHADTLRGKLLAQPSHFVRRAVESVDQERAYALAGKEEVGFVDEWKSARWWFFAG